MKVEYDPARNLLYIWFGVPGEKVARTETVVPGVHAVFDAQGSLVGIEALNAASADAMQNQ